MDRRRRARLLDDHPLFVGEGRRQRRVYARHADQVLLAAGSVLVREGHQPTQVTFIRSGRAGVSRFGEWLREVGPGQVVGAAELARVEVSDVTVTALDPIDAVVLHRRAFRGAWRALPGVRARVVARRPVGV